DQAGGQALPGLRPPPDRRPRPPLTSPSEAPPRMAGPGARHWTRRRQRTTAPAARSAPDGAGSAGSVARTVADGLLLRRDGGGLVLGGGRGRRRVERADPPRLLRALGQPVGVRVADLLQRQAVGGRHVHGGVADAGGE